MASNKKQAIVVGGGLGGMSAANTVLENGGNVVLLDKSSFCGGNSTKATSGINGAGTRTQKDKGITDNTEIFTADTLKGGAKKPEIVKVLCENSGRDVEWLMDAFNLDLSLVARLGGHSQPRTHRGKERFPGMTITYAQIQMLEKVCEVTDKARIITKAKVHKLLMEGGACVGCIYEKGGQDSKEMGPVILASGGFGADFTANSLLAQYRPDLIHLPTTNGEHCTGDGIKMGEAIGARTIDLEWVQVHPTGLVKPDDADAKIKFLAAEALRGVGGLIFDADGKRFANELGRRDYVTGEMWKNKAPFRLALNKAASDEIIWHCKHYTGRGVMKYYKSGADFASDLGVPVSVLEQQHDLHYQAAKKTEKDPDGGSYPAYPSGKSWDEASGKTGSGKKFYHNIIPGSDFAKQEFYVAIITPVIHYCMGGLEIDQNSACVDAKGKPIPGLYAAGEVAGGVHGNNRLGGNSLLDCVVFGRVAGRHAAKYMLGSDVRTVDLQALANGGPQAIVVGGGLGGMSAANTVLENGARVVLLDKSSFCGGNSTKATSGINGAGTRTQKAKGINDNTEIFTSDTLKGGAKKPEIVKVLCENSGRDVEWLMDAFDLDLSLVARLGGHSQPRTHRGKERFPGMTITYAQIQMLEKICEVTDNKRARIITKAKVHTLTMEGNACVGCVYEKGGQEFKERGPVILASGGFGADFTANSLLAQYRPDLIHLPTTNGEHCTGDGIKMGEAIGAKSIDLEWVQVHPTGLVKPDDADAKIKFLAAEALRGVGGLIFDADGKRFANELGRRDYVTGEMWKNKAPFRLALNKAASDEIIWHCKHYTGRGVMKYYPSGAKFAEDLGVAVSVLEQQHEEHYQAAKKTEKDPDGGSWPAYPSGKSWDQASGKTGSGKKFYHNIIPGSAVKDQEFYVAIITPVIHYCMGGLEIDQDSACVDANGKAIPGLYAAGEVAGGVHGNNRLGGNSLLDCVVFGRVAGRAAAKAMLGSDVKKVDLKQLAGGGPQAIVVGGGLGGMSAANTVLENGGKVVLLDKSSFCGGNSTKATSGINGAGTRTQKEKGINDTTEIFTSDTLKGGAKKPEIVKVLCENSGRDVEWLMDAFNLDLSLVARLGGHSQPRTHRGKERFPGMTITYALIQMLEKVSETTDKARIITKAKVHTLLTEEGGYENAVIGCIYEKGGQNYTERGPVILASGGFGADFTSNSLLAQYRPDLIHLPTTNGEHCTGDGIKMGEAIGAKSIDLEWVQVHPTGLVKPDDADAKIKFLAAEALRGVGGLIFDAEGKRFANELGRRDYVTGEMWKNKAPFRLALNKAASDEIIWHCKHYTGRGVMKYYASGKDFAADIGVPVSVLEQQHEEHYQAAKKTEKDPDGGSWPAYPSGKSWDQASGKTGSGKKFYHNIIPGSAVKDQEFYVAIITPVIHYCMGGLEIDEDSACVNSDGKAIAGLYAAGEVAGGVHGNNRLGGNSLLDCVVFGRVAGKAAAKYMLGSDVKKVDLKALSGGGLTGEVKSSKFSGGSYEDGMNKTAAPTGASAAPATGGGGGFTLDEVAKHTTKSDCWVVVNGQVLNVTSFLGEHPGGELAILTFAGKDASEEFNMIHPPDVIPKYAPNAVIGMIGSGGGGGGAAAAPALPPGMSAYTKEEVAKHTTKQDCWVILEDKVLNVTNFLSQHPGGELAILTFAGKDATEEFNMIHPPDVVGKYAPDAIIGIVGTAEQAAAAAGSAGPAGGSAPLPVSKDKGNVLANHHAWGTLEGTPNWRYGIMDENPGVLIVNVQAYLFATWYLWVSILYEVCATIFSCKNIKISNDRTGLTRSAILLILFIVIHAVGNLHVFKGPDDFNGYGYFYVRLYWTGFGLPANIVEEYILLSVILHVFVGLKRTWDQKLALMKSQGLGVLNLAITGIMLLTFMTIHLFQFRFGDTDQFGAYMIRAPPYLINIWGIPSLTLFWTENKDVQPVGVRDIYALEFQLFQNPLWSGFYIFSVFIFMTHACLGWKKVTPVLGIPRGHISKVEIYGYLIFITLGAIYISFPLWCMFTEPDAGMQTSINPGRVG